MTAVAAPVVTARVFVTKAHWVRALPGFRSFGDSRPDHQHGNHDGDGQQ